MFRNISIKIANPVLVSVLQDTVSETKIFIKTWPRIFGKVNTNPKYRTRERDRTKPREHVERMSYERLPKEALKYKVTASDICTHLSHTLEDRINKHVIHES